MTSRVVVFRFDRNPLICRVRVAQLRRLNPGVPIFGLYGGAGGYRRAAFRMGSRMVLGLDGFYASRQGPRWNWKNGDLALAAWYRDVGYRIDFDVAHLVEWDLLFLDSLQRLYAAVPPEAVGLTACTALGDLGGNWDWLRGEENVRQLNDLRKYACERWGFHDELQACLGVGPCFPKSFLADYAALDPPELCHDELRLPLFARVLGYPVADTRLRHSWHSPEEDIFFNARGLDIRQSTIMAEARRKDGRRAFHPVRRGVFHGSAQRRGRVGDQTLDPVGRQGQLP